MNTERTASIGGDASGISIARDRNGVQAPALPAADVPRRTEEYLEAVGREWAWVRLEGEGGAPLPLERVFFMLQARPQPQRRPLEPPRPDLEPSPERLEAAGAPPEEPAPPPPPVPLGQALREAEHLALLGEPGAGKSTALQFIGLCFACAKEGWHTERLGVEAPLIPVLLQLPVRAEAFARGKTLWKALIKAVCDRLEPCTEEEADALLRSWSDEKRLLVLLDGLDEVREAEREAVYRAIQSFVHSGRGRVVVASRPAGFSSLVGVKEYTLKPFEDPEKEALPYLRGWLQALKPEWAPQAEEKARRLLEEMRARPALARLLNNPLLLRLSAEHYVRTGRVAESRAALYEAWVEEAWRRAEKRGAPADQKGTALQALETLAWHLQTGGSHGEEALREGLERAGLPDPQGLLRLLREGTGLLARFAGEQEGRTVYSYFFAHQTVQEYFVARRLARAWRANSCRTFAFLRPRLHLPAWREPLALLAGMLPEEEALALLRRIQRAKSPGERHLRRDLFLAADLARESGRWEAARAHLLPVLIGALRDKEWFVRRAAAEALGKIGTPAVPALIGALGNEDVEVRWAAAEALRKIGTPAVLALIGALRDDEDADVRQAAAWALGSIGDPQAVSALIEALRDESNDKEVRRAAAWALGEIGDPQAVLDLNRALGDEDALVRQAAAEALGEIGDPQAVLDLNRALGDKDARVRRAAAKALGEIGAPQAVLDLNRALGDKDALVRWAAARALGGIGDPQAVPALIGALRDEDTRVRWAAVEALGKIGTPAVPALIGALRDEDVEVRWAAEALGKIGTPAVPALIGALGDEYARVRWAAAEALGEIGDPQAVLDLIGALRDEDAEVRRAAAEALGEIGDPQAVLDLNRALGDKDARVRRAAAWALGKIGTPAVLALIEALRDALIGALRDDEDADVRQAAAWALGSIGDPQAVPALIGALGDEDERVSWAAAEALGKIGTPAVLALIGALRDEDVEVRRAAAEALGEIGDPQAVLDLNRALRDEDAEVRRAAAWALGEIGDPQAVLDLNRALGDEDALVRRAAAEALRKIGTPAVPALIGALGDEDVEVRWAAAEALGKTGDPQAVPALIGALGDEDALVRWAAAEALEAILSRMPIPVDAGERRALRHRLRQVQRAAVKLNDHDLLDAVLGARSALEAAASPWQDPLQPSPGEARRAQVRRALGRVAGGAALLLLLGGAGLAAVLVAGAQGALKEALQPLWQEWPLAALVGLVFLLAALAGLLGWGIEALRSARRRGAD
jgi:HEAT repeat protein